MKGFTDHSSALWSTFCLFIPSFCLFIPSFCSSKWPECTEDWHMKIFYPRNYIELNWIAVFILMTAKKHNSVCKHHLLQHSKVYKFDHRLYFWLSYNYHNNQRLFFSIAFTCWPGTYNRGAVCFNWILVLLRWMSGFCTLNVCPSLQTQMQPSWPYLMNTELSSLLKWL